MTSHAASQVGADAVATRACPASALCRGALGCSAARPAAAALWPLDRPRSLGRALRWDRGKKHADHDQDVAGSCRRRPRSSSLLLSVAAPRDSGVLPGFPPARFSSVPLSLLLPHDCSGRYIVSSGPGWSSAVARVASILPNPSRSRLRPDFEDILHCKRYSAASRYRPPTLGAGDSSFPHREQIKCTQVFDDTASPYKGTRSAVFLLRLLFLLLLIQ